MTPGRDITQGTLVAAIGIAAFVSLAVWASTDRLFPFETAFSRSLQRMSFAGLGDFEAFANEIGARRSFYFGLAGLVAVFAVAQRWSLCVLALSAAPVTATGAVLKQIVGRPRPDESEVVAIHGAASGFSFPSGHALQASTICAVVAIAAFELLHGWPRRLVVAGAVSFALIIGWQRIYHGVHWPTDVAAGFILGALLTLAAWRVIRLVEVRAPRAETGALRWPARPRRRSQ